MSLWSKIEPISVPFSKALGSSVSASPIGANSLKLNGKHPYGKSKLEELIRECFAVRNLSFTDTVITLRVSPTTVRRVCRTLKIGRYGDPIPSELRSKSSQTPYGWKSVLGILEKEPSEWANVELMFQLQKLGFSLHKIAAELSERAAPTKNGGKWFAKTISQIMNFNAKHILE